MGDGAAGCSIDERESFRLFGTAWNLFASGAMECRPVSWGAVACIRFSRRAMDRWGGVQPGRMFDEIKSFL